MFDKYINLYQKDMIRNLQRLIKIKSVKGRKTLERPFGKGPLKALEYVLKLGEELGFKVKNIDGYAGHIEFGQGEEILGIITHVDVVPEGEGWTIPAFSGKVIDGKIYGRGAIDDKGPLISTLYAMKALLDSGTILNKRVRLIIGTNEEHSWEDIDYYLTKEEAPDLAFTPDAYFPVIHSEKGIIDFDFSLSFKSYSSTMLDLIKLLGGNSRDTVPNKCTAVFKIKDYEYIPYIKAQLYKFNAQNKTQIILSIVDDTLTLSIEDSVNHHLKDEIVSNAISYMIYFISSLSLPLENDIIKFLNEYHKKIGLNYLGFPLNMAINDEVLSKLIINIGTINLNRRRVQIKGDIRYPINLNNEIIKKRIMKKLKCTNIIYSEIEHIPPLHIDKNSALIKTLMQTYREYTGDFESEPIEISGCTYGRIFKNTVAFGPVFPNQEEVSHESDEFIEINHLVKISKIYAKAIYELSK